MSSEQRPPDEDFDRDLDAFLRGEDAVSRAYAKTGRPMPPEGLDAAVLRFARESGQKTSRVGWARWQRPLALAAVLVLGVSVTLNLWREPRVRGPQPPPSADAAMSVQPASPAVTAAVEKEAPDVARRTTDTVVMPSPSAAAPVAAPEPKRKSTAGSPAPGRVPATATASRPEPAVAEPAPPPPPPSQIETVQSLAVSPVPTPIPSRGAADFAAADALSQRERSVAARAARREASREMSAMVAPKSAPIPAAWQAPVFDTLAVRGTSREQVHARYGEPTSKGVSDPDAANPDQRRFDYDAYERIPGIDGVVEFYYERMSGKLLSVRRVMASPQPVTQLVAALGWNESPLVRNWQNPPCGLEPLSKSEPSEAPFYWVYPQRGAYLFLPAEGMAEQIVYESECR